MPDCEKLAEPLHIAVLEDDTELREAILLPGLRDYGFAVSGAGTSSELYRLMLAQRFNIVTLDIGLPNESGLTVARHLRELFADLGIIMITGNQAKQDHLNALDLGADAYLSKPVDIDVLAATLHSVARRLRPSLQHLAPSRTFDLSVPNHWQLTTDGWCLLSPNGVVLALTKPERCVLSILIDAEGETVSRETLIAGLVENVYGFDPHRLEMLIHRLRRKAEEAKAGSLPLLTSRGAGYLFRPT